MHIVCWWSSSHKTAVRTLSVGGVPVTKQQCAHCLLVEFQSQSNSAHIVCWWSSSHKTAVRTFSVGGVPVTKQQCAYCLLVVFQSQNNNVHIVCWWSSSHKTTVRTLSVGGVPVTFQFFVFNTNLAFLTFLCKRGFQKISAKSKFTSSGNYTHNTDHHWVRSQKLISTLPPRHELNRRS